MNQHILLLSVVKSFVVLFPSPASVTALTDTVYFVPGYLFSIVIDVFVVLYDRLSSNPGKYSFVPCTATFKMHSKILEYLKLLDQLYLTCSECVEHRQLYLFFRIIKSRGLASYV